VSYAWSAMRLELLDMTSVADGRTHAITSAEFERACWRALAGIARCAEQMSWSGRWPLVRVRSAPAVLSATERASAQRFRLGWSYGSHDARVASVRDAVRDGPMLQSGQDSPGDGARHRAGRCWPVGAGGCRISLKCYLDAKNSCRAA
jgi:hypothetical protein